MQISKNFPLDEFLVSETAERFGIDMTPPEHVIDNIEILVNDFLQPLRSTVGRALIVSSGYRPLELNTAIRGSKTSAHIDGRAADFRVSGMSPYDVCKLIERMMMPYDQLIHEFGRWTHLGIADEPRCQELTAYKDGKKTKYVEGIHTMEELT